MRVVIEGQGNAKVDTYVYADVILVENLIMNYLILWSTARLTRYNYSRTKLAIASVIGAVYALLSYFPQYSYLFSFLMKILFSILIVIIAYTPQYFHLLLKLLGIFYIVSFIFGGAAFGLFYFINGLSLTSNGISFIEDFPLKILTASIILAYIAIKYSWDYVQHRIKRERLIIRVELFFDGRSLSLDALVDTGNSLKDPLTNAPVVITEYSMMKELLPEEIRRIFESCGENDLNAIAEIMTVSKWASRFRLIPFKSLGRENGMLVGFKPDGLTIIDNGRKIQANSTIIAIYRKNLSKDGEYSALVHPELLKEN